MWPRKPRFRCLSLPLGHQIMCSISDMPPHSSSSSSLSCLLYLHSTVQEAIQLIFACVFYRYISQTADLSSQEWCLSSHHQFLQARKCQRRGLVFTIQHSCSSSLQEGHVIDLDADALSKLRAFASLFTFQGELTYPRFKLPTGSAFLRSYLKERGKVLPVNITWNCLSQMANITLNFLNKEFHLNFYLRLCGRML